MEPKLFINGSWRDARRGSRLDVINPATERVFQQCAAGGAEDIDVAVASAKAAIQGPWRRTSGKDRAKFLRAIAGAIEERKQALAEIEVKDNGKPLPEALWDIGDAAYCFNLYVCSATSRMIVQECMASMLLDRLADEAKKITIGDA